MLKMAMLKKKIKVDMVTPSLDEDCEAMAFRLKEINSSASNSIFHLILSE
jgi:hypothetical protein